MPLRYSGNSRNTFLSVGPGAACLDRCPKKGLSNLIFLFFISFFFSLAVSEARGSSRARDQPAAWQRPRWILNPLCHTGTPALPDTGPVFLFGPSVGLDCDVLPSPRRFALWMSTGQGVWTQGTVGASQAGPAEA